MLQVARLAPKLVGKISNDAEIKGWCKEFEAKNGVREVGVVTV